MIKKLTILFFLLPLFWAEKAHSQASIVSDPGLYVFIEAIQATLVEMAGADQAAEAKKAAEDATKMEKLIESIGVFAQNVKSAEQTLHILNTMFCLLDEIKVLNQRRQKYGFSSCYASVEFDMYKIRITGLISVMTGLFKEGGERTGQEKNTDWSNVNEKLSKLKEDMLVGKYKLTSEIVAFESKDVAMKENVNRANNSWRFYGGIGR
jgi:hypothetical protein